MVGSQEKRPFTGYVFLTGYSCAEKNPEHNKKQNLDDEIEKCAH
jgi:hypothetical protein